MDVQVHDTNSGLFQDCLRLAQEAGLGVAVFHTNGSRFAGTWRYSVHHGEERPWGTRSKDVIDWWETPNSKWYKPSIKGERECLEGMRDWFKEHIWIFS